MKKTLYEYYLRSLSWALNHPNAGMDIDTATINFIDKPDVMYYGTFHELLKNTELEPLLDKYYIIQTTGEDNGVSRQVVSGANGTYSGIAFIGDTLQVFETSGSPAYNGMGILSNATNVQTEEVEVTTAQ